MPTDGLFGTNAPLIADITLALSLFVIALLTAGALLARMGRIRAHGRVQTVAVLLNLTLVGAVMLGSYLRGVQPGLPARAAEPYYLIGLVHGLAGLAAALFGGFVLLRGHGLVPAALRFRSYKPYMRAAYGLYLLATALGATLYGIWYVAPQPIALATIVQREGELLVPMVDFSYSPREIVVPVGTTIIWVNQDGAPHNAIADDGSFATPLLAAGEQATTRLDVAGEFPFFCELHGAAGGADMAGLLRVVPAEQAPPPVAALVQPAGARPHLDALLVAGAGLPARQGYATGLRLQSEELSRHAALLVQAHAAGDADGTRRHAEHVFNLAAGSLDPRFGDLNGDGRAQNPGDGFGLLANAAQAGYIDAVGGATRAAAAAPDASEAIRLHAGHVLAATANLAGWSAELRELAYRLAGPATPQAGEPSRLLVLAEQIRVGADVNGDGEVAPVAGEAGALVAYEHVTFMAGLLPAQH